MARYKFQFWLNGDKDDELLVAETIDELKTRRSFSAVVRDGIMIVNELRQGRVDLLLKLFPFVLDAIAERLPPPTPPTPPSMNTDELLAEFRRIFAERPIPDGREGGFPLMQPAPKGLGAHAIAMPVIIDDDDDDTVVISTAAISMSNSQNSMASMLEIAF